MNRFPWQIFTRVVLVQAVLVLLAIGGSAITARYFFKQQFIGQVESQLKDTLQALDVDIPAQYPLGISGQWCRGHSAQTPLRFTVLRRDGTVLCDSILNPTEMENLANRLEVRAAFAKSTGEAMRFSVSTGQETVYAALFRADKGLLIRAAYPLVRLNETLHVLDTSITLFLFLIAIALGGFAVWSGRMLVFPIGRLLVKTQNVLQGQHSTSDLLGPTDPLREESYGEWSELESSIDDIRRDLIAKAESLSLEREELATLMSAISDAILAVDTEGRPLFFNSRFALLFGNQEALRQPGVRLWEMFRVPELLEAFKAALGRGQTSEVKAVSLDGDSQSKRFFSVSVSPLRKQSGNINIYGAVGIFHDVTDLKGAEQIRIDFVANVSHELRTPLTSIKGYTDTLLLDIQEGRPVEKEFLDIISRNVDRLMNLIRDLLDLSSLESTDVIHKAAINTAELTSRVIRQLQGAFTARRQVVTERYEAIVVMADSRRIEQVLVNLLENANKYTPPGGEIRINWENEANSVVLHVSDNGPGIPLEHHARLFERFYRVDKARSRDQGGTGLGLAIVKHIMQRHEGTVSIESQPGRGSSFTCRFPG